MYKITTTLLFFTAIFISQTLAQAPVANFTGSPLKGCAPLIVSFTDQSTNNPTSWNWTITNGTVTQTSTQKNPSFTLNVAGFYTVTLVATNASGSNTHTKTSYVEVNGNPTANFTNTTPICAGQVQFTDASTVGASPSAPINFYQWNIAGQPYSDPNPAPFLAEGTYNVSLYVRDGNNCQNTVERTITVQPKPTASFSAPDGQRNSCNVPQSVNFTAATITGATYTWYFKNSTANNWTAVGPNNGPTVTRSYNQYGSFDVALTVNLNGCKDSIVQFGYVNIQQFFLQISTSPTPLDSICPDEMYSVCESAGVAWDWNVDGIPWNQQCFNHLHNTSGNKTISVRVTSASGCIKDTSFKIVVNPKPVFTISSTPNIGCSLPFNSIVDYSPKNTGDVVSNSLFSGVPFDYPNLTLTSSGTYWIGLTVTNKFGCSNTLYTSEDYIKVREPDAEFTVTDPIKRNDTYKCEGETWTFNDASTAVTGIKNWTWDFTRENDPTDYPVFSTVQNPQYTFQDSGVYWVRLTVEDSLGCTHTDSNKVEVGKKAKPHFYIVTSDTSLTELDPIDQTSSYYWSSDKYLQDSVNNFLVYPKVPHVYCHFTNWEGDRPRTRGDSMYVRFHKITGLNEWADKWTFYYGRSPGDTIDVGILGEEGDTSKWNNNVNQKWEFSKEDRFWEDSVNYWRMPDSATFFLRIITDHYGCLDTLTIDSLITILPPVPDFIATYEDNPFTEFVTICPQDYRAWHDGNPITGSPIIFTPKEEKTRYFIKFNDPLDYENQDHSDTINNFSYTWHFGNENVKYINAPNDTLIVDTLQNKRWIDSIAVIYAEPGVYDVSLAIEKIYEFGADYVFSPPTPKINQKVCRDTILKEKFVRVSDMTLKFTILDNPDATSNTTFEFCRNDTAFLYNTSILFPTENSISDIKWYFDTISGIWSLNTIDSITPFKYDSSGNFYPTLIIKDIWECVDTVTFQQMKFVNQNQELIESLVIWKLPIPGFQSYDLDMNGDTVFYDRPTGCAPLTINLLDTSIYQETHTYGEVWNWSFINFETGEIALDTSVIKINNASVTFPTVTIPKGEYNAFFKVTDNHGCSDSLIWEKYVKPTFPISDFRINELLPDSFIQCWNQNISFFNFSSSNHADNIIESKWAFIDTSVVLITTPDPNYPQGNSTVQYQFDPTVTDGKNLTDFWVKLTVKDGNECISDTAFKVYLSRPLPDFTALKTDTTCPPFNAKFNDNSLTDINYWYWDFGAGGLNSFEPNPQYFYEWPGDYDITLTVRNNLGCEDTKVKTQYIEIGGPRAKLVLTNNSGCAPLEVQYEAQDIANIDEGTWVFGGGYTEPVNVLNPITSFTYSDPRNFPGTPLTGPLPIGLRAVQKLATGDCIVNYTDEVNIRGAYPDFNNLSFVCGSTGGTSITFNDNSAIWFANDPIIQYNWDFGDGSAINNQQNPNHTFNTPVDTIFTISLGVNTIECQSDITSKNVSIFMGSKFDFAVTSDPGCAPVNYNFAIDTTGNKHQIYNYTWNIPSNVNGAITGLNVDSIVTVAYANSENGKEELISLTIRYGISSTEFCERTESKRIPIEAPAAVLSSFDVDRDPIYATAPFNFLNNSTNDVKWDWTFGDGNSSNIENPSHSYLRSGEYPVMLISYSSKETCLDTAYLMVKVRAGNFIPNVFTPNGDGRNDGFRIVGEFLDNYYIEIYNRWGKKVWDTNDFFASWDGTINGSPATEGTYFYKATGKDAVGDVHLTGTITLLKE
jgi:gliding motility-associated-like protein